MRESEERKKKIKKIGGGGGGGGRGARGVFERRRREIGSRGTGGLKKKIK